MTKLSYKKKWQKYTDFLFSLLQISLLRNLILDGYKRLYNFCSG